MFAEHSAPLPERQTVADVREGWLETTAHPSGRASTQAGNFGVVRHHLTLDLGWIRLNRLTPDEVEGMRNGKPEAGLSPLSDQIRDDHLRSILHRPVRCGTPVRGRHPLPGAPWDGPISIPGFGALV